MAVGEDQIVAQIKAAARAAAAAGTTGPAISGLIDAALRASKRPARRPRSAPEVSRSPGLAWTSPTRTWAGSPPAMRLCWGPGSMGKLAARLLREAGVGRLSVASRNAARAAEVAAAVRGSNCRPATCPPRLADADILITATGAAEPVVPAEQVRAARAQPAAGRCSARLGMPPDVDPACGAPGRGHARRPHRTRRHLADRAVPDQIPQSGLLSPRRPRGTPSGRNKRRQRPSSPRCTHRSGSSRTPNWTGCTTGSRTSSEQQRAETAATVHRILRKILHRPTVRAKEFSTGPNGPSYLDALRQLFDLSARADDAHAT